METNKISAPRTGGAGSCYNFGPGPKVIHEIVDWVTICWIRFYWCARKLFRFFMDSESSDFVFLLVQKIVSPFFIASKNVEVGFYWCTKILIPILSIRKK